VRINNSTSKSKKGLKQAFDLLGMMSDVIELVEERGAKILWVFKESIVRDVLARVVPDALGRIQLRPVRRKLEYFHVAAVGFEPVIGFLLFVIRGIVLNQVDPMAAPVKGWHHHLLQEGQIGFPLKIILLMKVDEIGVVEAYGAKDLLRIALAAGRNLRLASPSGLEPVINFMLAT